MRRGGGGAGGRTHCELSPHVMTVAAAASATPVSLKPLSNAMASLSAAASVTAMDAVFHAVHGPPEQATANVPSGAGGSTV